jgi:hypothetical protein
MAFEFKGGTPGRMLLGILTILAIVAFILLVFSPPSTETIPEEEQAGIGDTIAQGSPMGVARRIAQVHGSPVVLITAANCALYRMAPEGVSVTGPFRLSRIDSAVALARQLEPAC